MTDPADDRAAVAKAMRIRKRTTPIEPHSFFNSLDETDSLALAYFIIEIGALEETLHHVVSQRGNKPAKELDRATLGMLVGWVEPMLINHPDRDKLVGDLRELNKLRIAVVHGLPELQEFEGTVVWSFNYLRPNTNQDGQTVDQRIDVEADDLDVYATMAWLAREKLSGLAAA